MSGSDRQKWDNKYRQKPDLLKMRPPSPMLQKYLHFSTGKQALDLACGSGRNTLFLASKGYHVDAVDISRVALAHLRQQVHNSSVSLIEADLDTFVPEQERYDLVVMANYLDRALIERTLNQLPAEALFIVETYMAHPENEKKDSNPAFLLQSGELKKIFEGTGDILGYEEFWNEPYELYKMRKQAIAVLKR